MWQQEAQVVDKNATFKPDNVKVICHFKCGKWISVNIPYDLTKFQKHVLHCKKEGKAGNSKPLHTFFQWKKEEEVKKCPSSDKSESNRESNVKRICPGITITIQIQPKIKQYLAQTGACGGGSVSVVVLVKQMYGKTFTNLRASQQDKVKEAQFQTLRWHNDHLRQCVRAVKCIQKDQEVLPKNSEICQNCKSVSHSKAFKKSLAKKTPSITNYKFLNKEYKNKELGMIYMKTKGVSELFNEHVGIG